VTKYKVHWAGWANENDGWQLSDIVPEQMKRDYDHVLGDLTKIADLNSMILEEDLDALLNEEEVADKSGHSVDAKKFIM